MIQSRSSSGAAAARQAAFLGEDAFAAELGNVRRAKDQLQERERAIRDHLRRTR